MTQPLHPLVSALWGLALCGLAVANLALAETPPEEQHEAAGQEEAEGGQTEHGESHRGAEDGTASQVADSSQGPDTSRDLDTPQDPDSPEDPDMTQDEVENPTELYDKTIRWATASEVDNFGYDIYRGESADGPFTRLTDEPITGAGTTDEPSYYTYIDKGLDPTKDYYYYVESISMFGQRERFTPIQKVAARLAEPTNDAAEPTADPAEAKGPEQPEH